MADVTGSGVEVGWTLAKKIKYGAAHLVSGTLRDDFGSLGERQQ